jgi:hypothetical protein
LRCRTDIFALVELPAAFLNYLTVFLLLPAALLVVLRIAAFWNPGRAIAAGWITSGQESGFRAALRRPSPLR